MSIEMHVLFSGRLPSKTRLARTMRDLGFPITIGRGVKSPDLYCGYIPMRLQGEEAGVEVATFDDPRGVEEIAEQHADPRFQRAVSFRWGGDEMEMLCGMCSAAAIATLVDGKVLDGESGDLMTPAEAADSARRALQSHLGQSEPPDGNVGGRAGRRVVPGGMHVLFGGKLPDKAALARTLKELEFPLTLRSTRGSLELQRGVLPMRLEGKHTGVEFDTFNGRAAVEKVAAGFDIDPRFDRGANLRWGRDETELLAADCLAAALATLVDGVVLSDGDIWALSAESARASARAHLASVRSPPHPRPASATRPADLKRYLQPLLELRSDLVLVGRMLLIRPVRHLLRGAYFDRTSDPYALKVHEFVHPLCCYSSPYTWGAHRDWLVWPSHFPSLLIDWLAEELFSWVGKVTTLDDFAALPFSNRWFYRAQIVTRLLMGGRDHAAELVRRTENELIQRELAGFLNARPEDVAALCARGHADEARVARELKLDRVWEPSPFPIELPEGDRTTVAEPSFPVVPWVRRPPWLLAEAPARSGEVLYARSLIWREGLPLLVMPLAPEEAEERHNAREEYLLAARLPDGFLLLIQQHDGDRNRPPRFGQAWSPQQRLVVLLHGHTHWASIDFDPIGVGIFQAFMVQVGGGIRWLCYVYPETKMVYDPDLRTVSLTSDERSLATWAAPAFGAYEDVAKRIRLLLQVLGYGELT